MVKKQGEAIAWLKQEASYMIDNYTDGDYEADTVGDVIIDLLKDIDLILEKNWEWVCIEECPMAVSNINVYEMRKA